MKSIGYLWISSILLPWSAVSGHPCNIDKMVQSIDIEETGSQWERRNIKEISLSLWTNQAVTKPMRNHSLYSTEKTHSELQIQEIRTSDYEIVSHRRKLQFLHIGATKKPSSLENATAAITTPSTQTAGKNWIYFAGFVLLAIILSLLIALIVKCKLLHKKHASYHHQRLPDSRSIGSSHIEEGDMGMAYGRNQPISGASECYPEDDDGFIEDNYIVSNQELKEEEEDLELEPHFKVGRSF
ncbi:PREDICTED: leucine-rich repeat-containing protein 19-like isoform X3 [Thamnophis sirtalis]|uniref:Leucine-rich repeat-containing protein 19-like isoform X3 n=1 Tax=Thamnophis sirtalis TaxID=35019 RepID=A0A6I9XMG4_9SAUR|nr:PREDICTED: leucine-rich repeat-containing protein 19-like isoform X3 [Thamnophis sirtalis]